MSAHVCYLCTKSVHTTLNPTTANLSIGTLSASTGTTSFGSANNIILTLGGGASSVNSITTINETSSASQQLIINKNTAATWILGNVDVKQGNGHTMSAGNLTLNGTFDFDHAADRKFTLSGGTLNYNNAGAIQTHTATTSTSGFIITGGSLDNTSGAAITTSTTNPRMTWGGDWTFIGTNGADSNLNLGNGAVFLTATRQLSVTNAATTLTVGGIISGTGFGLTKAGNGTLELSGANTNTGTTTVNAGTLQFAKQVSLYNNTTGNWTAANINVKSGGTLALNVGGTGEFTTGNVTTLLTNLAASSTATNGMNAGSNFGFDTTNASGGTFTISDVIANTTGASGGSRGLVKLGTNTLILSGDNTYTGATFVNAGTLRIDGSTLASSSFTVADGGTLGGSGTIGGTVTLESGSTLAPGASIESLATGSNTWNGGSTYQFEFSTNGSTGTAGAQWDLLAITGTLDLTGASSSNQITFDLVSMQNATQSGLLGSWDPNANTTWAGIVTTTGGITGFASDLFAFDDSGFQNTINGSFNISQNGTNLDLNYVTNYVIPEPKAALLGAIGVLLLFRRRR